MNSKEKTCNKGYIAGLKVVRDLLISYPEVKTKHTLDELNRMIKEEEIRR